MDKLKNLLHPGKKDDDEVLYGSGQSSDPIHSGTTAATDTTGTNPADPAVPLAGGSFGHLEEGGRQSNPLDNTGSVAKSSTADTGSSALGSGTTGTYDDPRAADTTSGLGNTSARGAGAYVDDASSTTAIRGGVSGNTQTGTAVTDSTLDPAAGESFGHLEEGGRHSNPLDNSGDVGNTYDTTGTGSSTNTSKVEEVAALRGEPNTLNPHTDNTTLGTDSTALGTDSSAIGSGQTSRDLPNRSVGSSTGGSSSITDKIREVAAGRGERGAQDVTKSDRDFPLSGGNSSTVTDTRGAGYGSTPSEGYGSTGAGASELGRDAMLGGAAAGGVGLAEHEHHRDIGDTTDPTSDTTAGTTGTSHLGRDAALGGTAVGGAGLAEHEHRRDIGDTTGNTTGATTDATTSSTTGLGSGNGEEGWDHDHSQPHSFEGDPCGPGAEPVGPHFTDGPHITDTANRLDPNASTTGAHTHGSSTTSTGLGSSTGTGLESSTGTGLGSSTGTGLESSTGTGLGSSTDTGFGSSTGTGRETTTGQENTTGAHTGRDAALVGGAGVAGVGAYEEGRHHDTTSTGTDPSQTGPVHKSSLLNKLDPRVKQDTTSTQGAAGVEGPGVTDQSGHGYRTEDVGGMAGARVVAPYETEKKDHHLGRDAVGGAALGSAGYEAEKHGDTGGSSQYGGFEPLGHKHHDPAQPSSIANTGSSEYPGMHHDDLGDSSKHEKKSGGILGFLHKDKSDKDTTAPETTGAGAGGVLEHEKHDRNRLHKDPPASMMAGNTDYAEAPTTSTGEGTVDPTTSSTANTTGTGGTGQYGQTL